MAIYSFCFYHVRFGSKTEGQSVASSSNSNKTEARTRCDLPKRRALQRGRPVLRAGRVASSPRPPALQSRPSPPQPHRCPFGARPPSPRCQTHSLPPPPACSDPTPWPILKRLDTARATLVPHPTLGAWTAARTWRPCTISWPGQDPLWAPWAATLSPVTWTSLPRPSPRKVTAPRGSASTPPRIAWIIRTKRPRGNWTSMPTAWITKIRLPPGNSRCCEANETSAILSNQHTKRP